MTITEVLSVLAGWAGEPWFTIGATPISLARLVGVVVILAASWWVASLLERALRRIAQRGTAVNLSESGVYALTRVVRYLVLILGTLFGLRHLGFDLATLTVIGGAIGIGVGFGLQSLAANFISGVVILLERTLKVGDFVDLQSGVVGTVTEISMRYTRVTTNDNVDVIVPNSEFVNGRVINWTLDERVRRIRVPFGVAYGSDKALVREAGLAAAATVPGVVIDEHRRPDVWLVGFGDSSLDFEIVVWVGQELMTRPGRAQAQFYWALETELARRGIEIPFPQRDLHLRSGAVTLALDRPGEGPGGGTLRFARG